jgi:hypothetical protein
VYQPKAVGLALRVRSDYRFPYLQSIVKFAVPKIYVDFNRLKTDYFYDDTTIMIMSNGQKLSFMITDFYHFAIGRIANSAAYCAGKYPRMLPLNSLVSIGFKNDLIHVVSGVSLLNGEGHASPRTLPVGLWIIG